MEKLNFGESVHVHKTKLNMSKHKDELLILCNEVIKNQPNVKSDGFGYKMITNNVDFLGKIDIKNKLDEIIQISINNCVELYKTKNIEFNVVQTDGWVNVVRAKNPVQSNFMEGQEKYHIHTEINKKMGMFTPIYTYVYYIQMPNNLKNEDGVLWFKDSNDVEYSILPKEDELLIMPADIPHAPNSSPNSTVDRLVFAGNVGFGFIKKEKSLL